MTVMLRSGQGLTSCLCTFFCGMIVEIFRPILNWVVFLVIGKEEFFQLSFPLGYVFANIFS